MDQQATSALRRKLKAAESQLEQWVSQQQTDMEQLCQSHKREMQEDKENMEALTTNKQRVKDAAARAAAEKSKQEEQIEALRKELQNLETLQKKFSGRKAQAQLQLAQEKQNIELQQQALQAREGEVDKQRDKASSELKSFEEYLGLKFKSSQGGISAVFTRVDPTDHAKKFSIDLAVTEEGLYQVKGISPQVEGLDTMVAMLNDNNDLGGFIKTLRRKFKDMC